jgi:hypothetical protein
MNRRNFLAAAGAALAGLALGGREALATIRPVPARPLALYGDGLHDDTEAINAWAAGKPVQYADGTPVDKHIIHDQYLLVSDSIRFVTPGYHAMYNCRIQASSDFKGSALIYTDSEDKIFLKFDGCDFWGPSTNPTNFCYVEAGPGSDWRVPHSALKITGRSNLYRSTAWA